MRPSFDNTAFFLLGYVLVPLLAGGCRTAQTVPAEACSDCRLPTVAAGAECPPEPAPAPIEPIAATPLAQSDSLVRPVAAHQEPAEEEAESSETLSQPDGVLELSDVIDVALQANPDIHSAVEQIDIADATLMRARAEFYPTLGITENYGVTDNPVMAFSFQLNQGGLTFNQDFNNPRTIDDFDTKLRYQHRLYAGGQRLAERDGALAGLSAASFGLEAVQNQLVFRVAEAYYRLLQAEELLGVREEAVRQVEQHLEIVQARFRAETAVKSDVLSVQVRLAEVREALITARNQVELAWAVLNNVTGNPLERHPLPDEVPRAPWTDHVDQVQEAVGQALSRRAELGQLANQQSAAAYGVEAARSPKRFSVDFVTDYDVFTGDFRRGSDSFFTGLVVSLNLFDGGRTIADVRKAMGRVRELEARQRRAMLDIELDVRRSHLQLNDAEERLKVATQAIEQARESLREIEVRYRGQTATITQLIDAQVALSNAQVRQANARAEVEVARAAVERAVGRLTDAVGR